MQIAGLQKLTLLDFPGRTAATIFLDGCNFRCPYCHNGALVVPQAKEGEQADAFGSDAVDTASFPGALTVAELLAFLKKRQGLLDGVCVSGGEPLLHAGLAELLHEIKALGYQLKLDTNGAFPERLQALVEAGLVDMVAMDIKNSRALYQKTCGCSEQALAAVEKSVQYLMRGSIPYEFRTTCVKPLHTPEGLAALAAWIAGAERYYLQNYVARDSVLKPEGLASFSEAELQELLAAVTPYVPHAAIRGEA